MMGTQQRQERVKVREKTWYQLESEINETFRKWQLRPPRIECTCPRRNVDKLPQTPTERTVALRFSLRTKEIYLKESRNARSVDNLAALAKAVEWLRLCDVRGITSQVVNFCRQIYPLDQPPPPPPPPPSYQPPPFYARMESSGPFEVLHIANDAPLEVAEAAYRVLVKQAHPDVGGNVKRMQQLNAAIEQIRRMRK